LSEGKLLSEEETLELAGLKRSKAFFEKKVRRVEHDLFILNKDPMDLQKFPVSFT
jgi:hypothetical protein